MTSIRTNFVSEYDKAQWRVLFDGYADFWLEKSPRLPRTHGAGVQGGPAKCNLRMLAAPRSAAAGSASCVEFPVPYLLNNLIPLSSPSSVSGNMRPPSRL